MAAQSSAMAVRQIQSADEAKGAIEASRPIETDITSQTKTKRESGAQRI
jgi:hypothetical protein